MSSDDDPPTSTNANGGGKQSLEIDFDKLFRNGDDEPAANIVVVSSADRCNRKPRRKSTENDSNSSSFADESLSQKSDVELKLQIERYDKSFSSLSRTLPDKGLKMKLERERVQAELDRRSLVRKTTRVDDGCKNPGQELQKSNGEPDRLKQTAPSSQTLGSSEFGSLFREKMKNDPELCLNTGAKPRNGFHEEMSFMNPCDRRKRNAVGKLSQTKRAKYGLVSKEFSTWNHSNGSQIQQKYGRIDKFLTRKPSTQDKPPGSFTVKNGLKGLGSKAANDDKEECTVVLLDEEEPEAIEKLQEPEIRRSRRNERRNECKIFYPSREDPESLEIFRSELRCLEPGECLTSTIMNFYIRFLQQQYSTSDKSKQKFYFFNTYFYSKLQEAVTRQNEEAFFIKFRRWWRGVNIFEKTYIFLPINEDKHWSLVIVCISDEDDSGVIILHLDSLGLHCSRSIFKNVKSLLENEWKYLKEDDDAAIPDILKGNLSERIDGKTIEATRQTNDYDCGLFVLYYIERFIQDAPEKMKEEHFSKFGRKWFKAHDASSLRGKIKKILQEEFQKAPTADNSLWESVCLPAKPHAVLTRRDTVNLALSDP